jgi:hypothetical protein
MRIKEGRYKDYFEVEGFDNFKKTQSRKPLRVKNSGMTKAQRYERLVSLMRRSKNG